MKRLILISLFFIAACSKNNSTDTSIPEPTPSGKTPIVFLHGFLGSGDTYETQSKRFTSNGYSLADLYTFDWNTLSFGTDNAGALDKFVDEVLAKTGASQIDLVGHSAGTAVVQDYLKKHRSKVKHLVLLAGFPPARQDSTPILNVYSTGDYVVSAVSDVIGGTNLKLVGKDHYQVATCPESFEAMYKFFNNGESPVTSTYTPEKDVILSGKSGAFGENKFSANTVVEIYKVDPVTGFRTSPYYEKRFETDAKGFWGPFRADPTAYYEFVVYEKNPESRKIHYYREPFTRSDKMIYLRTFPIGVSLVGVFLASLPKDDRQSVTVFFGSNGAVNADHDVLTLNGHTLSTQTFCAKENTTIALFSYDDNKNKATDLYSVSSFTSLPFLRGADIYFQTDTSETITMTLNGRSLHARNWKSASEGVNVIVFE